MKLSKVSLFAAAALAGMALASAASAQVAFNAGIATDYVFRGIKQTYDATGGAAPEVFGGVDWSGGPNLYAGLWASNTGWSSDNGVELDYYAGWKPKLGPVSLDLGVIYYTYNNSTNGTVLNDFNTLEWKAAGSLAAGPAVLGAAVFYSNDYASTGDSSWYYEVNGSVPVKDGVSLSGAIGQFKADAFKGTGGPDSYTTWNLGITVPVTEKVSLDARYIGTDNDATNIGFFSNFVGAPLAVDDAFVGTIKATF
jgi:uncharacterized protein (TIGR02001 family)